MSAFIDARSLAADTVVTTDVCVIGAGAAGITIARDLAGTRHDVCLVESGGFELEPETQELYRGDVVGRPYLPLEASRLRYFGGSTNHWAGWCAPLDALDFEKREWVPGSGWPISRTDLVPFYERAQRTLQLADFEYDAEAWATSGRPDVAVAGDVRSAMWQFSPPTRFGDVYREELEQAPNVRVFHHANMTALSTTPAGDNVESLVFRTLEGNSFRVAARSFVLACGGIENARILLLANDEGGDGLAIESDEVGRYFMEHAHVTTGMCVVADPNASLDLYAGRARRRLFEGDGILARIENRITRTELVPRSVATRAGLRISDEAQRRDGLLNAVGILVSPRSPEAMTRHVHNTISHAADPEDQALEAYDVRLQVEQAPNRDSSVTLGDERDALGLRRARLDWRLSELDTHTIVRATYLLARALGQTDLGRLRIDDWLRTDPASFEGAYGGNHHIGTTRMSDDPRSGVVDRDCRVHGISNLFVAGSSVFPTGGFANPTLTLTALAHRLADHLADDAI